MADRNNTRLAAANILLDRGVRFTISGAPFLLRMLRLNKFYIKPLRAGTILEISRLFDENGLDNIQMQKDANLKLDVLCRIISAAILNGKFKIACFSGLLAKLLLWKMPAKALKEICDRIARLNKVTDFMSITIYFGIQAQMMMNPRNMGQARKGS